MVESYFGFIPFPVCSHKSTLVALAKKEVSLTSCKCGANYMNKYPGALFKAVEDWLTVVL